MSEPKEDPEAKIHALIDEIIAHEPFFQTLLRLNEEVSRNGDCEVNRENVLSIRVCSDGGVIITTHSKGQAGKKNSVSFEPLNSLSPSVRAAFKFLAVVIKHLNQKRSQH